MRLFRVLTVLTVPMEKITHFRDKSKREPAQRRLPFGCALTTGAPITEILVSGRSHCFGSSKEPVWFLLVDKAQNRQA